LISNAERVLNLNDREIYGKAFAKADEQQLRAAIQINNPSQRVNLIAIEAPNNGEGVYTKEQIKYALRACYTAFKAAKIMAEKTYLMNLGRDQKQDYTNHDVLRTNIHTGWWGCGAYGNNRQMMIITQIIGALWANIDTIRFHTENDNYQEDINSALEKVKALKSRPDFEEAIEGIYRMNLDWKKSNDT
jgi:hypothetical protein